MTRVTAGLAVLCLFAAITVHAAQDRWFPPAPEHYPAILYVRSPDTMRRLALEYDGITADVYWIRALQAFGRERLQPAGVARRYELLFPLLDLTTTLDPYFSIAYRFGAIFLGEPYPGGPGRPDLAIALLRKGLKQQPQRWQYMQDLGFVYYWHLQDYKSAAHWFERASQQPGAPNWMRPLAAVTLTEGGQRRSARALWRQIAQSDQQWLRDTAAHRLAQLDALDEIDRIQPHVDAFHRARPGERVTWPALTAGGWLPGTPVDPTRTPFAVDPSTGHVAVARDSPLWPMPGDNPEPPR